MKTKIKFWEFIGLRAIMVFDIFRASWFPWNLGLKLDDIFIFAINFTLIFYLKSIANAIKTQFILKGF
jgi:hypothetical protein